MESRTHRPPAFVFGMTVNGLSVLRSLGRRGVECYGFDFDETKIGFFSRYCSRRVLIGDPLRDPEGVMAVVRRLASRQDGRPVLFVTSDDYLDMFTSRLREVDGLFRHFLSPPEVLGNILDKGRLARIAAAAAVPCPGTLESGSLADPAGLPVPFPFPVLVKPATSHLGRRNALFSKGKVLVADDAPALTAMLRAGRESGIGLLIQEIVPGPDSEIFIFRAYYPLAGGPPAVFVKRKLRQYPIHFGYGCVTESVRQPEVVRLGQRLIAALSYRGLAGVEFKRDARDGVFKLIEVNARSSMTDGLAVASGVDFPWIAYGDLTGGAVEAAAEYSVGLRWFRVRHDLAALRQYRREGSVSFRSWLRSYRGPKVFSTVSRRDPLPLLKRLAWQSLGPLKQRLRGRFFD